MKKKKDGKTKDIRNKNFLNKMLSRSKGEHKKRKEMISVKLENEKQKIIMKEKR
jgi:hypothetical protein